MSSESIKPSVTLKSLLNPRLDYFNNSKFRVGFGESCLKPDTVAFLCNKIINVHITYGTKSLLHHGGTNFTVRHFFI